ncbi:hypothetical protein LOAG_04378 [Loa loa]|uniref:Uncharacterized protein n=1 Tax=Loa loa TaxID=7209 RepID=A0A1S0U2A0_LOALO|nr:hypothetical protein LOAG_01153 [Loa loa]XP_003139963.1 hypothetical protein LOAG_04378 [Loa loa]EFO24112.1 hypothetical protein LOAG_04378 [Loa loa]EFO27324.1 hypothetical protein LOAG_01153 [Loa loa]
MVTVVTAKKDEEVYPTSCTLCPGQVSDKTFSTFSNDSLKSAIGRFENPLTDPDTYAHTQTQTTHNIQHTHTHT